MTDRRPSAALIALPAIGLLGASAAIAFATGRYDTAYGDAWSYLRVAFNFANTGHFVLNGYVSTAFAGQAFAAAPVLRVFPDSLVAAYTWSLVVTAIGAVAVASLARRVLAAGDSMFATLVVYASPIVGVLAFGFHTDLTAFSAQMICLALAIPAFERKSVPLLVAALVVGFWGVTVREFAVTAPLAVLVIGAVALRVPTRPFKSSVVLVAGGCFSVAAFGFALWRRSLPNAEEFPLGVSLSGMGRYLPQALVTLGILLIPVAFCVPLRRVWAEARQRSAALSLAIVALGFVLIVAALVGWVPILGNLVGDSGRQSVLDFGVGGLWALVRGLGAWALTVGALSAVAVSDRWQLRARVRTNPGTLVLPLATVLAGFPILAYVVFSSKYPPFDRYLLPLLPGLAIMVVAAGARFRVAARRRVAVGWVALLVFVAGSGLVTAVRSVDRSEAWRQAQAVRAAGVPVDRITAFGTWVPFNGPFQYEAAFSGADTGELRSGSCVLITSRRKSGRQWVLVARSNPPTLSGDRRRVYTFALRGSDCLTKIRKKK